jgi:hypothetical protein
MLMLLISHIVIVISSLTLSAVGLVKPTPGILKASYLLIAGTVGSGTALVIISSQPILKSCLSGLFYLAAISVITAISWRRMATERIK